MVYKKFKLGTFDNYTDFVPLLIQEACKFKSSLELSYNDTHVNMKSLMGLLSYIIPTGTEVCVSASGEDEDVALSMILCFIAGYMKKD